MFNKPWKTTSNKKSLYCKKIYIVSEQAKAVVLSGLTLYESGLFFLEDPRFCVTMMLKMTASWLFSKFKWRRFGKRISAIFGLLPMANTLSRPSSFQNFFPKKKN